MILKILFRMFLGCVAFVLLIVAVAGVSVWMAMSEPSFYAELKAQAYTAADAQEVEERLMAETADIEKWMVSSIANDQNMQQLADNGAQPQPPENKSIVLTQDDLNALFAGGEYSQGDLQNLRIQIQEDRIRMAGEIFAGEDASVVVTADLRLTMGADDKLKLEILGGKIGRLPLPTQWLLQMIPQNELAGDENVEFCFHDPVPHILIDVIDSQNTPNLEGIKASEGEVKLEFSAPRL
ncbi:MAG: hypothetical protein AAF456_02055 [Planctomycetota bacterium]